MLVLKAQYFAQTMSVLVMHLFAQVMKHLFPGVCCMIHSVEWLV